jgi:penicillin-binding protein 1C
VEAGDAPRIVSPTDGMTYLIDPVAGGRITLSCQVREEVSSVFWYVNDRLLQSGPPDQDLFLDPVEGRVKISCTDDRGRNSDAWIEVERL